MAKSFVGRAQQLHIPKKQLVKTPEQKKKTGTETISKTTQGRKQHEQKWLEDKLIEEIFYNYELNKVGKEILKSKETKKYNNNETTETKEYYKGRKAGTKRVIKKKDGQPINGRDKKINKYYENIEKLNEKQRYKLIETANFAEQLAKQGKIEKAKKLIEETGFKDNISIEIKEIPIKKEEITTPKENAREYLLRRRKEETNKREEQLKEVERENPVFKTSQERILKKDIEWDVEREERTKFFERQQITTPYGALPEDIRKTIASGFTYVDPIIVGKELSVGTAQWVWRQYLKNHYPEFKEEIENEHKLAKIKSKEEMKKALENPATYIIPLIPATLKVTPAIVKNVNEITSQIKINRFNKKFKNQIITDEMAKDIAKLNKDVAVEVKVRSIENVEGKSFSKSGSGGTTKITELKYDLSKPKLVNPNKLTKPDYLLLEGQVKTQSLTGTRADIKGTSKLPTKPTELTTPTGNIIKTTKPLKIVMNFEEFMKAISKQGQEIRLGEGVVRLSKLNKNQKAILIQQILIDKNALSKLPYTEQIYMKGLLKGLRKTKNEPFKDKSFRQRIPKEKKKTTKIEDQRNRLEFEEKKKLGGREQQIRELETATEITTKYWDVITGKYHEIPIRIQKTTNKPSLLESITKKKTVSETINKKTGQVTKKFSDGTTKTYKPIKIKSGDEEFITLAEVKTKTKTELAKPKEKTKSKKKQETKTKVSSKEKQRIKQEYKASIKEGLTSKEGSKNSSKDKTKEKSKSKTIQIVTPAEKEANDFIDKYVENIDEDTKTETKRRIRTKIGLTYFYGTPKSPEQEPIPDEIKDPILHDFPKEPTKKKPPKKTLPTRTELLKKALLYKILLQQRNEKPAKYGNLATKKEAVETGRAIADNTKYNKFKVKRVKDTLETIRNKIPHVHPQKFTKKGNTWIEKKEYRKDSKGEDISLLSLIKTR